MMLARLLVFTVWMQPERGIIALQACVRRLAKLSVHDAKKIKKDVSQPSDSVTMMVKNFTAPLISLNQLQLNWKKMVDLVI